MNDKKILMAEAVVVLLCLALCGAAFYFAVILDPFTMPVPAETIEPVLLTDENVIIVAWILGGLVVLSLIVLLIRKGFLVPLIVLAVIAGFVYVFAFADKNNDGVDDPLVIRMIQPTGGDAGNDAAYSEVNRTNAVSNVFSASSFLLYVVAFILGSIGIGFLFVMKK